MGVTLSQQVETTIPCRKGGEEVGRQEPRQSQGFSEGKAGGKAKAGGRSHTECVVAVVGA